MLAKCTCFTVLEKVCHVYISVVFVCVQVVREEDITEFFEQLTARKRQKTLESAMQYYCK